MQRDIRTVKFARQKAAKQIKNNFSLFWENMK